MCISDWRLGRFIQTNVLQWSTTAGTGLVLPANRQRVGVLISHNVILTATQGFSVTFGGGTVVPLNGFLPYKMFTIEKYGILVQQAVAVAQLVASSAGTFTEFTLPEEYLAAGLEEFRSKYMK